MSNIRKHYSRSSNLGYERTSLKSNSLVFDSLILSSLAGADRLFSQDNKEKIKRQRKINQIIDEINSKRK